MGSTPILTSINQNFVNMLEKYNGNSVVIDQPSILKITGSVTIMHASGIDTLDENPTIQIGNIESYDPITPNPVEAEEIETTPSQGGQSGAQSGDDNPTNPENPGDDNPTTPQNPGNIQWADETHNPGDISSLSGTGWRSGYGDGGGNTPDGIRFIITNTLDQKVHFCGKLKLYAAPSGSNEDTEVFAHMRNADRYDFWMCNPYILNTGQQAFVELDWGENSWVNAQSQNLPLKAGWVFRNADGINPAVKLYHCVIDNEGETKVDDTAFIINVAPISGGITVQKGQIYHLNIIGVDKTVNSDGTGYNTSTTYPPTNN